MESFIIGRTSLFGPNYGTFPFYLCAQKVVQYCYSFNPPPPPPKKKLWKIPYFFVFLFIVTCKKIVGDLFCSQSVEITSMLLWKNKQIKFVDQQFEFYFLQFLTDWLLLKTNSSVNIILCNKQRTERRSFCVAVYLHNN